MKQYKATFIVQGRDDVEALAQAEAYLNGVDVDIDPRPVDRRATPGLPVPAPLVEDGFEEAP